MADPTAAKNVAETLEVDDGAFDLDDNASETTSLASTLLKGRMENGRRYAALRDDYWGPSDDQQFETMDQVHFTYLVLRGNEENILFASPIENPKRVLDIGTGPGTWAIDVADRYPDAEVHGVDLFPPPNTWVPPNCHLEVEDMTKEWTWTKPFDFIHMRFMVGAFTDEDWNDLYKKAYDNLEPGGWIEQVEPGVTVKSDDGTLDPNSTIAQWSTVLMACAKRGGRSISTVDEFRGKIEAAGFTNVHEQFFKVPIGGWAKNELQKEAGRINWHAWHDGAEGHALFLLTKLGPDEPWSKEKALEWTGQVQKEFKQKGRHLYQTARRVWAQKPLS